MRVLMVAGEASGDAHAAKVATALIAQGAKIVAVGGEHLERTGARLLAHIDDLSVLGIVEVVHRLPRILRIKRRIESHLHRDQLDLLLTVDYPGLNLRLAATASRRGLPVLHYIGPQVWAWRAHRVRRMKRSVNHVALVLPFEKPLYDAAGVTSSFVGHPLLEDEYEGVTPDLDLALLPGSRPQEVRHHLPLLLQAAARVREGRPDLRVGVSLAATAPPTQARRLLQQYGFDAERDLSQEPAGTLMRRARAVLVTSGTATLEAALSGRPFAVVYRTNAITYALARRLVKVPWVSLPNLIAEEPVVREFLQGDLQVEPLVREIHTLLDDDAERLRIAQGCQRVRERLGQPGASQRVAAIAQTIVRHPRRVVDTLENT